MNSERMVAHSCDGYLWVGFPQREGDHGTAIAQATARDGNPHGWIVNTVPLPAESVPAAAEVSAIVYRSRESTDSVIKVTIVASRVDQRAPAGHSVTLCSRQFDAYVEPMPDQATALERVSSVCGEGSSRLDGL